MALLVQQVRLVLQVHKDHKVNPDRQVLKDQLDQKVLRDLRELAVVEQVVVEHQEHLLNLRSPSISLTVMAM
jgi:hypothetical protein